MNTPTASTAGAAPAADVSPGPSPQATHSPTPGASTQQRMLQSVERRRAEAAQAAGTPDSMPPSAAQQAPGEGTDAGERLNSEGEKQTERTKDPESIPMAAFKERLGREKVKADGLRTQLAQRDLELRKATQAARLLQDTLNEFRQRAAEGIQFDEKDDQILQHQLMAKARQQLEQVTKEHQEVLRRQAAEMAQEQQREQLRSTYATAISGALERFPLVSRIELISALKVEARKSRPASAEQLAQVIHEKRLSEARRLGFSETPAVPSTVQRPGARPQNRFSNNAKGMEQWIRTNAPGRAS